ncbi:hypothetical protein GT347_11990 [Xylophilus rhododendri]|uniref:Uncharacterized protein n=1 Tax=Xylophilus rhododendri TaxID=2697032 RepID=A0A857J6L0_9BURK|nr:hypothetical protein [Xylophilus rhododendri]QHI98652.1 hypothetical protein GT347_11990 [Xylophilus rhododendri]
MLPHQPLSLSEPRRIWGRVTGRLASAAKAAVLAPSVRAELAELAEPSWQDEPTPAAEFRPPLQARQTGAGERLLRLPQGIDYGGLLLGPVFAEGSFKNAHEVLRPDGRSSGLVLLIEKSIHGRQIPAELARLAWLAQQGFPVADIVSTGHYRGHSAMLMPRRMGMIKPGIVWQPEMLAKFLQSPYVTRNTVRDLRLILWHMEVLGLRIIDLQMLLDPGNGSLQLSDPLDIVPGRTLAQPYPGHGPFGGAVQPLRYVLQQLYWRFPDMAAN